MATVPRHYRDKLVSSRVGTNTLDTSGAETARAITKMADQFQQVAGVAYQKQRDSLDQSEAARKKAEYVNKSGVAGAEIQKKFVEDPEEGYAVLTQKNKEIKDEVLSSVKSGRLRNMIGADIDGLAAQQSINNKKWQIASMSALEQQFLVDVQQMNIDTILQGTTNDEYEIMLGDDTFTEENYRKIWGAEEGTKNFRTAQDAMYRARATKLMEDGRFFDAQDFIQKRKEPTEKTRMEVEQNFLKMQKGAKAKRFFETVSAASVDVVEAQEGVIADQLTATQLDDRVLAVSAQAAAATDPDNQKVLIQYSKMLADIRDIKMENILLRAEGNTNTEALLQAQYERLFKREKDGIAVNNTEYLSSFMDFQNSVIQNAKNGDVSAKNYNKWMFWSKVALQGTDLKKMKKLDPDGGMKRKVKQFYKDSKDFSDTWKLDVLREVYENLPSDDIDLINKEALDQLFKRGKVVATLKQMGFPVDIADSKVISTSAGNFAVVGETADGMPIVNVGTMNMER
jgi:hypothetical protein